MTGHETGRVGGEKNRRACQLFDLAEPSHWCAHQELPAALGSIEQSCIQVRAKYTRNEGIDTNPRCRPFNRQRFSKGSDGRLARTVRSNLEERHKCRGGGSYLRIAAASRHDIGPSVSQSSSERKSDAAGSADHHGRFVCQIKKRMTHEALLRFAAA